MIASIFDCHSQNTHLSSVTTVLIDHVLQKTSQFKHIILIDHENHFDILA